MAKRIKNFRLSDATIERLEWLADKAEMNQTTYLEQLLKREAEREGGPTRDDPEPEYKGSEEQRAYWRERQRSYRERQGR